ncbi:MAG: polya polymerase [Desulfobacteraceae bacterium 4572_35.1]|nr:MAG: polya polymerase [Desulfobacteraceae bacterium 4572_35.1]
MDVITTHVNADFDCLGAMVAAKLLYPDAVMVFAGSQEPVVRDFLLTEMGRTQQFGRCKNIDFSAVTRLILVDVNSPDRIGPFAPLFDDPKVELHIYDHHPLSTMQREPDYAVIRAVGSAVTIMVAELKQQQQVPNAAQATMMMLGLYEDTDNLIIPTITQEDFSAAGYLLQHGADMIQVAAALTRELSAAQLELLHQLLQSLQLIPVHGVDVYIAQAAIDCYVGDIAVLAHKIRDIEKLDAVIIAVRLQDRVFMVGRSRIDEVNVAKVMEFFGGGGHATAAAATVHDKTLLQVMELLPKILEQTVVPHCQARHLMSSPVQSIDASLSIEQARNKLTRCHINALAVVDEGGQVVGIIARQIIELAVFHGLADQPVEEYMNTEFGVVSPDGDIDLLQQLVLNKRQRLVPIVEKSKLVGVVTRTDLLRYSVTEGRRLRSVAKKVGHDDGLSLSARHVNRLIDIRLPAEVRQLLKNISSVAAAQHMFVYAVGGFVRDLLLGEKNLDVDIVVEGNAIEFARAFAQTFECRVRSHEKFITAVIIFPDGFKVDVASTRTEHYMEPGALPLVEEASIKLDLYRRDFTINTLALSLHADTFGELLDYFGAQRDLHDKAIRVLHNLSFVEDPTRAYRAVRFEQRFGFKLGLHTERLLRSAVNMGFVAKVSSARLFNELFIILNEDDPYPAVQRLYQLGLLQFLSDDFNMDDSLRRQFRQAGKVINWYNLLYSGVYIQREVVYFLILCTTLNADEMISLCGKLSLPHKLEQLLVVQRNHYLSVYHHLERHHKHIDQLANSEVYQLLNGVREEMVLYFMARTKYESVRSLLSRYVTGLRSTTIELSGNDLLNMGVAAGPEIGRLLHLVLNAKLDGELKTLQDEKDFVSKLISRDPDVAAQ